MGLSGSKQVEENFEKKDMKFILDENIKKEIDVLGKYIANFNQGDMTALLKIVDEYSDSIKKFLPNSSIASIKKFVGEFHKELLDQITQENPDLSEEEQQKRLTEKLKDKNKHNNT